MVVTVYFLDEDYSQSHGCALLSLRSLLLHKSIHLRDYVRYLGRHRSYWLHLVVLDDVRRSSQSMLNMRLSPPFEWASIFIPFRLPLFKWLSRRPSTLSVIPVTTTLDSVRVPKGKQEMSRCCPTACVSLSSWVWLYVPTADVPIIIAALPGIVFLRYKTCVKFYVIRRIRGVLYLYVLPVV